MQQRLGQSQSPTSLDEWYSTINRIYYDRNFYRDVDSIMCHLVEVVGGLSVVASRKGRVNVDPDEWIDSFLAKSLGWWMVLCGKVGVRSVEDILWAKFPAVCTYCLQTVHDQERCSEVREHHHDPDWAKLKEIGESNRPARPTSLHEWREMYQKLFPRTDHTNQEKNFARLTEELGELAEAVRILPITQSTFLSEAADVFAWLMGVTNQMRADELERPRGLRNQWSPAQEHLDHIMWKEYPGKCGYCSGDSCKCPPILVATMNRIAHEGPRNSDFSLAPILTARQALRVFSMSNSVTLDGTTVALRDIQEDIARLQEAVRAAATSSAASSDDFSQLFNRLGDLLQELGNAEAGTQERLDAVIDFLKSMPTPEMSLLQHGLVAVNAGLLVSFVTGLH